MADPEALRAARRGLEYWNSWVTKHNLERVDFSNIDFTQPENQDIDFTEFPFGGGSCFNGSIFRYGTSFARASFENAVQFEGTRFKGRVDFAGASFGANNSFQGAIFEDWADFRQAHFGDEAGFDNVTFEGGVSFRRAQLGPGSRFRDVTVKSRSQFEDVVFGTGVVFTNAEFGGDTSFKGARFADSASFQGAKFSETASFDTGNVANSFDTVDFSRVQFGGPASFCDRSFEGAADFSSAYFHEPPDFRGAIRPENLDWTGVQFAFGRRRILGPLSISGWTTRSETVTRLRRLRGIAHEIHAIDAERDLFILERQAERGFLWKEWWDAGRRSRLSGWWRPLLPTILMCLYSAASDCGRSPVRPLAIFTGLNVGLYWIYELLTGRPLSLWADTAVRDFTIASTFPFGTTARSTLLSALEVLFRDSCTGVIRVPWEVQVTSAFQAVINVVLLFLLGLALRNHFKVR